MNDNWTFKRNRWTNISYQRVNLLQDLHELFGCYFHSVVQFPQRLRLEIFGQKALWKKWAVIQDFNQNRQPLHDKNGHNWLLTFLRPVSSPSTFSSFFAVCSTVFSMSFSFLSSASSSGLFCWKIIVSIWLYVQLNVRETLVKALPAFQSSWVCSLLSLRRRTDSLPCPLVIFLRFHCGHIKVKGGYSNWNSSVAKKREGYSLPLKMIFCEVCGTPVAWVRASDRSLTVGPLASSWPVKEMLCFVDPEYREQKHTHVT